MAAKNVLDLSSVEFKEFLDSFDYVFSDLDGVLWRGAPFPKAGDFINTLKKLGKKVYFVSNNSLRSHDKNVDKFREINFDLKYEDLYFPAKVIVDYLKTIHFNKAIYASTCEEAKKLFENNGFQCKTGPDDISDCDSPGDLEKFLVDDEDIGAVILDSDYRCNLGKIYRASNYLRRPEVLFIVGATDVYVPTQSGHRLLGTGHFNKILEDFTGRKPLTFGKPGLELLEYLKRDVGVENDNRVLFIGDMIDQDIAFGKAGGFQTLFVTSSFTVDHAIKKNMAPDYHVTALGDILPQFDKL